MGSFILGCGFYAQTNSLSIRANVRFRVRLVDAGTALRLLVNTVIFFFITFSFFEIAKFSRIKFSFRDTVQLEI